MYSLETPQNIKARPYKIVDLYCDALPASDKNMIESQYGDILEENHYRKIIVWHSKLALDQRYRQAETSFDISRIAFEFANLRKHRSDTEIRNFAEKYGLLGCDIPPLSVFDDNWNYINWKFSYENSHKKNNVSFSLAVLEPLELWEWHIDHVSKLLTLYGALIRYNANEGTIEDYLSCRNWQGDIKGAYEILWRDGTSTGVMLEDNLTDRDKFFLDAAKQVLIQNVNIMLKGAIDLSYSHVKLDKKRKLGLRFTEIRETPYLLAAIYYSLWLLISSEKAYRECECGDKFLLTKSGKEHCSNACRQQAYRKRKNEKEDKTNG